MMAAMMYWMIGYQNALDKFWWFALTLVLVNLSGSHLGMFASVLSRNIEAALAIMPMFLLPLMVRAARYHMACPCSCCC
jgi:ATP-binding cassette subfamily G (WHITE) protein 1/ATP-binding cassette subfamily G (WHITE) protein 2